MADPTGKAARVARSRAACSGCRSTKQRCDGPSRIPCRRCELYGLECEYPPSSGPTVSKPAARAAPAPYSPSFANASLALGSGGVGPGADTAMSERLREIAERLRSIETSLEAVQLNTGGGGGSLKDTNGLHSHHSPSSLPSLSHTQDGNTESTASSSNNQDAGHLSGVKSTNPMQQVNDTLDLIEASTIDAAANANTDDTLPDLVSSFKPTSPVVVGGGSETNAHQGGGGGGGNDEAWAKEQQNKIAARMFAGVPRPDAIVRGILTVEECDASFQIFFAKLARWWSGFDNVRDSDASAMRERSPILFHAILLSTSYYLMSSSERGAHIYYSLTLLVNELLSPLLVSALPSQINSDFLRALNLLVVWKPVQFASLYASGVTDPDAAEYSAKVNSFSSSIMAGVITRTAIAISLHEITATFAKSFSPTIAMAPQVVSDLRLWYWICIIDSHGALTTGRTPQVDVTGAVKTTRMFASLKLQTQDVRLAGTVELYGTARTALASQWHGGPRTIPAHELRKFNRDLDEWEEYWLEPMKEAELAGDESAWSTPVVLANFIRLVVNSSVFTRWRAERSVSLSRGGNGRPPLSAEDWGFLRRAVDAAEALAFSVSVESRTSDGPTTRRVQWPERPNGGPRPPLALDPEAVDQHRTAFDTMTCVVYIYSLILLAKLANTGLIRCELQLLTEEYEAGITLERPQRLVHGAKLGRMLELGAAFLDSIAPTPSHPARKHARMLRTILAAGMMGQVAPVDPDVLYKLAKNPACAKDSDAYASAGDAPTTQTGATPATSVSAAQHASLVATLQQAFPANNGPNFSLPALQPYDTAPTSEPGLALASILGGISPSFFGDVGAFDGGGVWTGMDPNLSEMAVDWDSLEKSISLQEPAPPFHPIDTSGYFATRH